MKLLLRLAFTASFASMLCVAGSWSGLLLDADCYAHAQTNTKAGTHPGSVDNSRMVRACAPTAKTTAFTVVQPDSTSFNLDSDGNQKARELVTKEGSMPRYKVNVTGDKDQNTVKVDTISIAK